MTDEPFVIWSFEHDAWWGPHRCGYVLELADAGRYSKEEALAIEHHANRYLRNDVTHEQALSLAEAERHGRPRRIDAGRFYGVTEDGQFQPTTPAPPDVWVCRRLADYPDGLAPFGAATTTCAMCHAPIAYNAGRLGSVPRDTPQVCFQCAGIEPLPFES